MPEGTGFSSLPFIVRKMLQFDFAASFRLRVRINSTWSSTFYVVGATRSGTFRYKIISGNAGAGWTQYINVNDVPLWVAVMDEGNNFSPGDMYVEVALEVNNDPVAQLCSGYIHKMHNISWPVNEGEYRAESHNSLFSLSDANPAAGAECVITVPTGQLWHIKSINVTLVTDSTVADRYVRWIMQDGTTTLATTLADTAQTASTTRTYTAFASNYFAPMTIDSMITLPMPYDIWLAPGSTMKTVTANLQAGDNFGAPSAQYRNYIISG